MFKFLMFLFSSHSLCALTTLTVTLNSDNNPGGFGEAGDLRYSLNTMNQDLNNNPDDYAVLFATPMTIQLNGELPIINNSTNTVNITIGNPGTIPTVTLDGNNGAFRGFFIPNGNVVIQNIIFQNMTARGGNGGDGISGGGGGLGAGGAIYTPQAFLNGTYPSVTLTNVLINNCSAVGGNGGNYAGNTLSGNEGGGGGGGFGGNGGSITTSGSTGGGGGGGFGGDGGNATTTSSSPVGGGGGGGGGIGSRATILPLENLGNGGSDLTSGQNGSAYGLTITAGTGGGGFSGGSLAGGGGGGGANTTFAGGGGGGSSGSNGLQPIGSIPPGGAASPSGGNGGDGAGGGGAGVITAGFTNGVDGKAGSGGYGGGGGGGSGLGFSDAGYSVDGGTGGIGGGGGGGGVSSSGLISANGGSSSGGGGGGGGGPSSGSESSGGVDMGYLGGGSGGSGSTEVGSQFGGGGGGGGSGLGGAIFVDNNVNFTLKAFSGVPTTFNTSNTSTEAGAHGEGGEGGSDGADGSKLGDSIFLRSGSSLSLVAEETADLLTLGDQVSFVDDTSFGAGGTMVSVTGKGTVIYNGSSDYQGSLRINNANFKVNGLIDHASISVCRNLSISQQRGTLSGSGSLTGDVFVNSGVISPDPASTLTLGSLTLSPANPQNETLGSLVHIDIDAGGVFSSVTVTGAAQLAGTLEFDIDPMAEIRSYKILTSSGITGTFDHIVFSGAVPDYTLTYDPTFVQINFFGSNLVLPPSNLEGTQKKNNFGLQYELYNQLQWTASPTNNLTGYNIYRDGVKIGTVDSSTLSFEDHSRKKGVTYSYSVTAFNQSGESAPITVTIKP